MTDWPFFDVLSSAPGWAAANVAVLVLILGYVGARLWVWLLAGLVLLFGIGASTAVVALWFAISLLLVLLPLRRTLLTRPLMGLVRATGLLPRISETEKVAIRAGTVWMEGELFSGRPDFARMLAEPYPCLTDEEQAFLDGPVEELCRVTEDWELWKTREFPEAAWDIIAREKLFGMIIPKKYGGLELTARANSAVVMKLNSRCGPLAITVMVPNSLGPAELLIHYGTEQQRDYYLPRLADAGLIPAFALTEPQAGSDAGAITASGTVFADADGQLKLRLEWKKRYITLAPFSGVLGLAFKLRDPENLLSKGERPGITCALIPTDTPGVVIGHRHDPLGVPFANGPTEGHGVIVPVEAIIGGAEGAGRGWQMLMESLAAGRGISLPAVATGGIKTAFLVSSAHAAVRKQFGLPIGKFEGIEEPLARIGGFAYVAEAARTYTLGAIDQGAAPAVVTAMVKYNLTELCRQAIIDAMDILGGNAISSGPRNLMASAFVATPIAITAEGANILTRTLIIFGQGAIRCHPWAYKAIQALEANDLRDFDKAIWGHAGHVIRNAFRCVLLGLTRGRLQRVPVRGPAARYLRKLGWASASFAFLADLAMAGLGGMLKRREKVTGRFADIFSWMYLAAATIRRFEAEGRRQEDLPYFKWAMDFAFARMQAAFEGLLKNLPIAGIMWLLRGPAFMWWRLNALSHGPSDVTGGRVAHHMQTPGPQRERLTRGCYVPTEEDQAMGTLQRAFALAVEADVVSVRLSRAVRAGRLVRGEDMSGKAVEAGIITEDERNLLEAAEAARWDAIQVDAFNVDVYRRHHQPAEPATV